MTDGIKLRSLVDERIMEKLVSLWQRASDKNTRLLQVAEVCPACPGQVGVMTDGLISIDVFSSQVVLTSLHQISRHLQSPGHQAVEGELLARAQREKETTA